jgi:hypothetical protein
MFTEHTAETGAAMAAKAAPPVAVAGANFLGLPVPDIVQYVTLAYVALMLLHKLWQIGWGMWKFWVLKQRDDKDDA